MSKFQMLYDMILMRQSGARRNLLWRTTGVLAAVLGFMAYDRSYLSTAWRMVTGKVQSAVPIEFELERAKTMVNDLIPDLRNNMYVIAQEEVAVDNLRRDVSKEDGELSSQREELLRMRADSGNAAGAFKFAGRTATSEEMQEEMARRFNRYKTSESTLDAKRQLLTAREKSLAAARSKLDNMLQVKQELEVQIGNLDARLKTQQSHAVKSSVKIDDSQMSSCKTLVEDLRVRLEVADRLLTATGEVEDMITLATVPPFDVVNQIDLQFGSQPKSANDVAKNEK